MNHRFLFLLGSTREGGNSELLARHAAKSFPAGAEATWIRLSERPLDPFVDIRHDAGAYPMPTGNGKALLDATLWATDLVFATPTYWYSLPAAAKLYLDHWTGWMRVPGLEFKAKMQGRRLWIITVNSNGPGEDAGSAPLVRTLELTAEYMHMRLAGILVGHGNRPGDVERDTAAIAAARGFFARSGPPSTPIVQ